MFNLTSCVYTNAILTIGCWVVVGLLVYMLILLVFSGMITKPRFTFGALPLRHAKIAYKFELATYKETPRLFRELRAIAPEVPLIGFYYDDPMVTKKQRYAIGAVLCTDGVAVNTKLMELYTSRGFKIFDFPDGSQYSGVRSEFPFVNMLSILFLVRRLYPAMNNLMKRLGMVGDAHPSPYIELYMTDRVIFFAPTERKTDFFVPEAKTKSD